jgi:hypothetical protein
MAQAETPKENSQKFAVRHIAEKTLFIREMGTEIPDGTNALLVQ